MNACSLAPEDEDDRTRFRRDSGQGSPKGRRDRTYESVSVSLSLPSFAAALTIPFPGFILACHLPSSRSPDLRLRLPQRQRDR